MIFLGRAIATLVALAVITIAITAVQVGADAVVGLQIELGYLLSTIVLCALLAVFHGSLALAIAGLRGRPALVMGIGLAVALAGCLVVALFPLSSVLAPWEHLSPWDWAFGGGPLEHATEAWRHLALAVPSVVLAGIGVVAVARRDIAAA